MSKATLKIMLLLSIFVGIVSGLLTIVPYIGELVFWALLLFAAPLIIVFLTNVGLLELKSVRQSTVIGALIGFVSFFVFALVYIPIVIVLAKFFNYSPNLGVSMFLGNATVGLILLLSIFISVLSATINAFSGFVAYYLIEFNRSIANSKDDEYTQFNMRK